MEIEIDTNSIFEVEAKLLNTVRLFGDWSNIIMIVKGYLIDDAVSDAE